MRVAITGASGLLGGNLAVMLAGEGHDVVGVRRPGATVDHLSGFRLEWREADLADLGALAAAFEGAERVYHCAAIVGLTPSVTPELHATNVIGTAHVVEACRRAGVRRLVHCSSAAAVGLSEDGSDVDESATWNLDRHGLHDGYAITKRDAEQLVREAVDAGMDAVIVNPTMIFGAYDARPSSGRMILDVARGRFRAGTPGVNGFVSATDVCRGMVAAADEGRAGERYILSGENWSYQEAFTRIARLAGVPPPRFVVPWMVAAAVGRAGDLGRRLGGDPEVHSTAVRWAFCTRFRFTSRKAERELGYRHGPPEDGIRAALEWFRERGMLPPVTRGADARRPAAAR